MAAIDTLAVICIAIDALIVYVAAKCLRKPEDPEEEIDFFDSLRLQREVQELAAKMSQLEALDNMIIDLRLCKPAEVLRAFRMEWQGAGGTSHAFDFMADGQNASSEYLMELAIEERSELNAEIAERIFDLYTRASKLSFYDSGE